MGRECNEMDRECNEMGRECNEMGRECNEMDRECNEGYHMNNCYGKIGKFCMYEHFIVE